MKHRWNMELNSQVQSQALQSNMIKHVLKADFNLFCGINIRFFFMNVYKGLIAWE